MWWTLPSICLSSSNPHGSEVAGPVQTCSSVLTAEDAVSQQDLAVIPPNVGAELRMSAKNGFFKVCVEKSFPGQASISGNPQNTTIKELQLTKYLSLKMLSNVSRSKIVS